MEQMGTCYWSTALSINAGSVSTGCMPRRALIYKITLMYTPGAPSAVVHVKRRRTSWRLVVVAPVSVAWRWAQMPASLVQTLARAHSLCSCAQTAHMDASESSHPLHSALPTTSMPLAPGLGRTSRKVVSQKSHQLPVFWPQVTQARMCAIMAHWERCSLQCCL